MTKRILVIQGHPDPRGGHFGNALAEAYAEAATAAGHAVKTIDVAKLDFPLLRDKTDFEKGDVPPVIADVQRDLLGADHVVILFPLWLGTLPAQLKAFLEQTLRPGFAFAYSEKGGLPKRLLAGKSARVVVTMGMPAFFYRWFFGAHGVKALRRSILGFCGFKPIKESLIGMIEDKNNAARGRWLERMREFGRNAK